MVVEEWQWMAMDDSGRTKVEDNGWQWKNGGWMAMDDSGRMRVGVVNGGGLAPKKTTIVSYKNKSNTRLLKTTTLMQWNPLMYA